MEKPTKPTTRKAAAASTMKPSGGLGLGLVTLRPAEAWVGDVERERERERGTDWAMGLGEIGDGTWGGSASWVGKTDR